LKIRLNGKQFNFLVDTGSSKSCVRLDVVRDILKLPINALNDDDAKSLISASGEMIHVCGTVCLNLNLNGVPYVHRFAVLNKLTNEFILGSDFLIATKAKINYSSNNVSLLEDSVILPFNAEVSEIDNCRAIVMADCLSRRNYSPADIRHLETLIYGEGTVSSIFEVPNPNGCKKNAGKICQITQLGQAADAMGGNETNYLPHFDHTDQNSFGSQTETITVPGLDETECKNSNNPQIQKFGLPKLIRPSKHLLVAEKSKMNLDRIIVNDDNDTMQDSNLESNNAIHISKIDFVCTGEPFKYSDLNKLSEFDKDASAAHENVKALSGRAIENVAHSEAVNKLAASVESLNLNSTLQDSCASANQIFKPPLQPVLASLPRDSKSNMGRIGHVSHSHVGPAMYVARMQPNFRPLDPSTPRLFTRFPLAGHFQGIRSDTRLVTPFRSITRGSGTPTDISSVMAVPPSPEPPSHLIAGTGPSGNYCDTPSTNTRERAVVGRHTVNCLLGAVSNSPSDRDPRIELCARTAPSDNNFVAPSQSTNRHNIGSSTDVDTPTNYFQLDGVNNCPLDRCANRTGGGVVSPLDGESKFLARPTGGDERVCLTNAKQTPAAESFKQYNSIKVRTSISRSQFVQRNTECRIPLAPNISPDRNSSNSKFSEFKFKYKKRLSSN
jgi:gag-polyprotein putative aspartyl protease